MNILLVEDDQPTAAYVEKGLRQAGHNVDCTGDGREGLIFIIGNDGTEPSFVTLISTKPGHKIIAKIAIERARQIDAPRWNPKNGSVLRVASGDRQDRQQERDRGHRVRRGRGHFLLAV